MRSRYYAPLEVTLIAKGGVHVLADSDDLAAWQCQRLLQVAQLICRKRVYNPSGWRYPVEPSATHV